MPVLLFSSREVPSSGYRHWVAIGASPAGLPADRRLPDLETLLEQAYDAIRDAWWTLGRRLSADPTAILAHAPACVANASDLGLMLAWTRLVQQWIGTGETILVVCDDPWVFRHLARLGVMRAGRPPRLWDREARLLLRGFLSRAKVAAGAALASLRLRSHRAGHPAGVPWLLVYGHPASTADGFDAYFGPLMAENPGLRRALHVDCGPGRAGGLAADGRTASLHAWGNTLAALALPFARWQPKGAGDPGPLRWLIRRAAALEGGTGQAAMIAWQRHCQARWLAAVRPCVVAWPWENHSWEREFVRKAKRLGIPTLGYQHATVGVREWNHAPASNPDGVASLPDHIVCSGPAGRRMLADYGVPEDRLAIGGGLRFSSVTDIPHDPAGPVFVALPFDHDISAQMLDAIRPLGARGWPFLVKDHPMTPHPFAESPGVRRTDMPLTRQAGLSAVLYAATTVGLEALLGGLPTLRFRPVGKVPVDPIPPWIAVPAVDAGTLEAALNDLRRPVRLAIDEIFSPPDPAAWRSLLIAPR